MSALMPLSDAAVRTHAEAIGYIYSQENFALTVKKSTMRRWARSGRQSRLHRSLSLRAPGRTATRNGLLSTTPTLSAVTCCSIKKREGDKEYQKERRKVGTEKPRKVGADIGSDVVATQTDRQTDRQPRQGSSSEQRNDWVTGEVTDSPNGACPHRLTTVVEQQHGMCNRCWVTAAAQRKAAS